MPVHDITTRRHIMLQPFNALGVEDGSFSDHKWCSYKIRWMVLVINISQTPETP